MSMKSVDPATLELVAETLELAPDELEMKLADSARTFESWRTTPLSARAELMKKLAEYLRSHAEPMAELATKEMGKIVRAGKGEVEKCALVCDYYADNAEDFLRPVSVATDASESFVRFDPIGPVLAIMPWNFPFWQVFRFAAPSLMAGNVGLLKHASNVQLCAQAIEDAFTAVGFPKGAFTNLPIRAGAVEAVIRDARIKAVTLTGSEGAGSQVAKVAGEELKKTVLELGGSDPFIVFADADLDLAAETAVAARLQNNAGQSCIAAKRFIVVESVREAFTSKLVERARALVIGNPMDPATQVGPLALEQVLLDVERQVKESVAKGAVVALGGSRRDGAGYFFEPTVLMGVAKGMSAYDEEVFGPVWAVIGVADEEEAVRVANDSPYGLGSTLFTRDLERAKKLAERIESGSVFINQAVKSDPRLPFGGIKKSGYGRELSREGMMEFVNVKTVSIK